MQRVIFIDFDGVLHDIDAGNIELSGPNLVVTGERLFEFVPILAALLAPHPDVQLVIHSSWRNHVPHDKLPDYVPMALRERIIGITPINLGRYESILRFVEAHGPLRYLILDDAVQEFYRAAAPPDELVVCPENDGLSASHVQEKIKAWLSQPGPTE